MAATLSYPTRTIDLNNHNRTASGENGVFMVNSSSKLTIIGDGIVTAVKQGGSAMAVWANWLNGQVVINGGTYKQSGVAESDNLELIYAYAQGKVYIQGGTFEASAPKWTLNLHDQSPNAKIIVTGGTFVGYNPATDANDAGITVAEGLAVQANKDGTYVVNPAARIGGGSNAVYLNEITARISGRKVLAGPAEATAIGNLINQMIFSGEFDSLNEARSAVKASYDIKQYN